MRKRNLTYIQVEAMNSLSEGCSFSIDSCVIIGLDVLRVVWTMHPATTWYQWFWTLFQVYVRIRDEEWNVYRRYSQFLDMHVRLKKVYPIVGKYDFPPKKAIGKKVSLLETFQQTWPLIPYNYIPFFRKKNPTWH